MRKCEELIDWADDIIVEYTYFAEVVARISSRVGKTFVLTAHDLVSETISNVPILYRSVQDFELNAFRLASLVAIANKNEADILHEAGIDAKLVPHPVDFQSESTFSKEFAVDLFKSKYSIDLRDRIIAMFIGSEFPPNKRAAEKVRYIAEICASREILNNITFVVGGAAYQTVSKDNFHAIGRIDDITLDCLYLLADFALIPLEVGTGASVKTLEALAKECCIISTSVGIRGYPLNDGYNCIVENDFDKYPSIIKELSEDAEGMKILKQNGRDFALSYDYRTVFYPYGLTSPQDRLK